jgi:PKD repeat protein
VYWDNKTGFIFSRKNGLPVPFNGHSDEFDMPESILLYNGTVPISDFWDISLYNGHSVLSYTGLRELEYNGSAIFYAPSWLNGNSNAHYKFPIPSTYTWNFAKTTIDCQMGYFLTQTNGSTSFGGYDTKYPPQLTFRTANYSEYSANLIWTRGQETTWEFWISAQPGSRSRIISVVSIPYDIYYNLTIQEEAANYYYVYLNTIYTAGNTFQNNVNAENGFAGYCLDNYQISDMCGDVDPGNYSSLKFDNWSFNYQDAPGAAFSVDKPSLMDGNPVQFTDLSDTAGFLATGWYWEFGDGQVSWEQNPTHIYGVEGSYQVSFRVATVKGFDWVINGSTVNVTKWEYNTGLESWQGVVITTSDLVYLFVIFGMVCIILIVVLREFWGRNNSGGS